MLLERHVVLVGPEIHWNTGNIGRTCLAAGAFLHLVKPLGFSLAEREVRRAGLDYWEKVRLSVWDSFGDLERALSVSPCEVALFSKRGARAFWEMPRKERLFLVFGSETGGLPASVTGRFPGQIFHIPISSEVRSLNLSTAAGIALYESLRDFPAPHAWAPEPSGPPRASERP